jgi:glyoxylase-like metal-dependent hydrolase (beta-lactamase superfamily II)
LERGSSKFTEKYEIDTAELIGVFDQLFDDNEKFPVGSILCEPLHLPGHTPNHIGYKIGHNIFTGDSIFNPDVGSARADFPGSSASDLYRSARALLSLPGHYRFYTGYDYPPESRTVSETGGKHKPYTTVAEQNESNKHIKAVHQKLTSSSGGQRGTVRLESPNCFTRLFNSTSAQVAYLARPVAVKSF